MQTDKTILVLAGSYHQFRTFLRENCLQPHQAKYIFSDKDLRGYGYKNKTFVKYGTWWENPMCDRFEAEEAMANQTEPTILSIEEFESEILRLANKFEQENGKWPNELHVGSLWRDAYDKIVDRFQTMGGIIQDPEGTIKHWWYMGMRVFYEHWTHCVDWTKETERIKQNQQSRRTNNGLEKGDYFAVTRGIKLNSTKFFSSLFFGGGESWKSNDDEPVYDRSYHDVIFQAVEVCWPMVAAKIIAGDKWKMENIPQVSLNLQEIEIMTLTKEYVDVFKRDK